MKAKIGVIRVLTTDNEDILNAHGRLIEKQFPDLTVDSRCIDDQPEGIYNEATCAVAVPKILRLGREMAQEGVKAIIVSCADDPGVEALRNAVDIPVIGAGSSCAGLSLCFGMRIGTLGIRESAPETMKEILGKHLIAERRPDGVRTTLDLLTEDGQKKAIDAVENLKEIGAEAIALACTGYSTIGIAKTLAKAVGIPVIDAVVASGMAAWYLSR